MPEPVLGVYVALSEIQIIFTLCVNMRYAIGVCNDFDRFVQTVAADGFVVLCADDPGAARLRAVPTPEPVWNM